MRRGIGPVLAIAVLFGVAGTWFGARKFQAEPGQAGAMDTFFSRSLPDAKGAPAALTQWKGRPLILNFWAPWCAACVEEMPELTALQKELQGKNIQILGIGVDNAASISAFADKYQIGYPLYVAGIDGSELSRQLGNTAGGLPFTVLVDASGKVKKTYLGRLKMNELRRDLSGL
jgi:thiol-disulfide isomerase/thioredoxin